MIPVVRDDGWWRPARRASWQVSRGWWWASMLVAVIALPPRPSAGQDFQVSVRDLTQRAMHVAVPLFGSVTVDSTVPITRANVIASDIADVQVISPTRLLITGQGYGTTNVVLFGGDDRQSLIEVSVELDLSRLNEAITEIDPRSTARAHSVLGNIILTGTVSGTDRADRIVELADLFLPPNATAGREPEVQNHLEVAGEHQVLLRCVVAEVSRRAVRELGVNGFVAGDDFSDMFLVNQIGGVNPINIGAAGDVLANATIPFVTGSGGIPLQPSATLSLGFPRVQLQTFIKALADNALLKVLAEPNLVAISGETATFLAGSFRSPFRRGTRRSRSSSASSACGSTSRRWFGAGSGFDCASRPRFRSWI
ncbi:MAG: pilus assembly protein N-terminal domain-containing protein [Phycisphaerae bacterium]